MKPRVFKRDGKWIAEVGREYPFLTWRFAMIFATTAWRFHS